ncbi:MAG: formimidoylglutamate deiminase, partial [Candidatus Eremiobacteraeota bacterium]|nr:formimidoylglutamate deiminase [Candidatus Eremiobacteraeota bacterium]
MVSLIFDHALLPDGWTADVRIEIAHGVITQVTPAARRDGANHVPGIAIPGMPNLHCHAFQKGMAGLAERRGPAHDSFWTWREVMYRFLRVLTPDDVEAIGSYAYMEMLEAGFTAVGEFHYLHHDPDGRPYNDIAEMMVRIAAAARQTGIGLTLLPSFYAQGGFGGAPPTPGQRRFVTDPGLFLRLIGRAQEIATTLPDASVGLAPHSLRAVTPQALRVVLDAVKHGPIHIHAAEQTQEVNDCIAALGARPVAWLIANASVDRRWCLVHATHMTERETQALARSGAVAGLCPLTEANLGDGLFNAEQYVTARGRFGIGSDSNIELDAAAELRQLEYNQRLRHHARNVLAPREGESVGRRLHADALAGGAQALGRAIGSIKVGQRADIVVLDADHPDLAGMTGDLWLDKYIFVAGRRLVRTVFVGGV